MSAVIRENLCVPITWTFTYWAGFLFIYLKHVCILCDSLEKIAVLLILLYVFRKCCFTTYRRDAKLQYKDKISRIYGVKL